MGGGVLGRRVNPQGARAQCGKASSADRLLGLSAAEMGVHIMKSPTKRVTAAQPLIAK